MPNQPGPNTVSTSFTLPSYLLEAVEKLAASEMTGKSDIIRRALMNYLTPVERARVQRQVSRISEVAPVYGAKKKAKIKNLSILIAFGILARFLIQWSEPLEFSKGDPLLYAANKIIE